VRPQDTTKLEQEQGFYGKYLVRRLGDKAKKHLDCEYFVLDLRHDKFAAPALRAYSNACREEFPALANDLRDKASDLERGLLSERADTAGT